jgi:hypothetical protein
VKSMHTPSASNQVGCTAEIVTVNRGDLDPSAGEEFVPIAATVVEIQMSTSQTGAPLW